MLPGTTRPFFRHHTSQQHRDCLIQAARIAALQLLCDCAAIDLPAPSATKSLTGASGQLYTTTIQGHPTRAAILSRKWVDTHAALLTLDDGRVIRVQIASHWALDNELDNAQNNDTCDGVITIDIDDPIIATWPPEKILERASLVGNWMCWNRHWDDVNLAEQALAAASAAANQALDYPPADLALPDWLTPLQRSESILHHVLKEILASTPDILVGPLEDTVSIAMPDATVATRTFTLAATTLHLSHPRLEQRRSDFIPDVVCTAQVQAGNEAGDHAGNKPPFDLIIEVAVTHRVESHKLATIAAAGLHCIELDAALLGHTGRITLAGLTTAVRLNATNKRWLHHPDHSRWRTQAIQELQHLAEAQRQEHAEQQARDQRFIDQGPELALQAYLDELRMTWRPGAPAKPAEGAPQPQLDRQGTKAHNQAIPSATLTRTQNLLVKLQLSAAAEPLFAGPGGILWQLDTLRHCARHPDPEAAFTVIKSAYKATPDIQRFISLPLIALHVYKPLLSPQNAQQVAAWRNHVRTSIEQASPAFARPRTYDAMLAILFPEMRPRLAMEQGTADYATKLQRKHQQDQRAALALKHQTEGMRIAQAQAEHHASRTTQQIEQAITDACYQFDWTNPAGWPYTLDSSIGFARRKHHDRAWCTPALAAAWAARETRRPLSLFLLDSRPQDTTAVHLITQLLVDARLLEPKSSG